MSFNLSLKNKIITVRTVKFATLDILFPASDNRIDLLVHILMYTH